MSLQRRYQNVTFTKSEGATYTPEVLADFVADQIVSTAALDGAGPIRMLDPAIGGGQLVLSLIRRLVTVTDRPLIVLGFEKDADALAEAKKRVHAEFPNVLWRVRQGDFLAHAAGLPESAGSFPLFADSQTELADLVIANPPYVRTQVLGAQQAQILANAFGLQGRVDLYFAFLMSIQKVLAPKGTAGVIVSNRFMSTRAGAPVRQALRTRFNLRAVFDMGDTKLFTAAVLPAVLLFDSKSGSNAVAPSFTKIYETNEAATRKAATALDALSLEGVSLLEDGRRVRVDSGQLNVSGPVDDVWRIATEHWDTWLSTVKAHTWGTFRDIGRIRVGVKTCADKVFIRTDWNDADDGRVPELLRPLTTHHVARRFKPLVPTRLRQILYPHYSAEGERRAVALDKYPIAKKYLESHRDALEARTYVREAGRSWYELWVPQDPAAWTQPKLVFRDISERPTFWIDLHGTVINGDCYWLVADDASRQDLLWLAAAVANSTFIEAFYDHKFNNKLYAGRRRFMTQYVEQFPLPDPGSVTARKIVRTARAIFDATDTRETAALESELDRMVLKAFGLN